MKAPKVENIELPANFRIVRGGRPAEQLFIRHLAWGTGAEGDEHLGIARGEIGLGFMAQGAPCYFMIGTPGDFRALLIDLLARLMEIEA